MMKRFLFLLIPSVCFGQVMPNPGGGGGSGGPTNGLTAAQVSANVASSNLITSAQATAAAQQTTTNTSGGMNFGAPTTNYASIHVVYGTTIGSQKETLLGTDGGITSGGYMTLGDNLGVSSFGLQGMFGFGIDVTHGIIGYSPRYPAFETYYQTSSGTPTNYNFPNGALGFEVGNYGQIIQNSPDTSTNAGELQMAYPQLIFTQPVMTNNTGNAPWGPITNVAGFGFLHGVFNMGTIQNPTFTLNNEGKNEAYVTGTVTPQVVLTTNQTQIGTAASTAVLATNWFTQNTNSIVISVGFVGTGYSTPGTIFTNNGALTAYISTLNNSKYFTNISGIWTEKGNGATNSANVINSSAWLTNGVSTPGAMSYLPITNSTTLVYNMNAPSNAAPFPTGLTNLFSLNTVVSNNWNERWYNEVYYSMSNATVILLTNYTRAQGGYIYGPATNKFNFLMSPMDNVCVSNYSTPAAVITTTWTTPL
jgi:hypothetical protein